MLQLQNYDVSSYAGLYIDVELIEAVVPLVADKRGQEGKVIAGATIYMISGKVWNVRQTVSEILDQISDYNEYMKGQVK